MFSTTLLTSLLTLSTSTALAADILVVVGGPGVLTFQPESVEAHVGDRVIFEFHQKNHTATQSTLADPCAPLEGGFDSGFFPVADDVTADFPQAFVTVSNTDPVWVYCRQGNHCQQGMVFAVNPGDKLEQFKATATGGNNTDTSTATGSASADVVTVTATVTVSGEVQTTTYATTLPSGSSTASTDYKVVVGGTGGKLTYEPSNIKANPGDTVTFEFQQKNHTVTQSTFDAPCRKVELTSTSGEVGFDSGFVPVSDDTTTDFPTYTIQVNDPKPIWAYCRQVNHCGSGMVFSVNAPDSGNTFDAFVAKAKELNGTTGSSTAGGATASQTDVDGAVGNNAATGFALATIAIVLSVFL